MRRVAEYTKDMLYRVKDDKFDTVVDLLPSQRTNRYECRFFSVDDQIHLPEPESEPKIQMENLPIFFFPRLAKKKSVIHDAVLHFSIPSYSYTAKNHRIIDIRLSANPGVSTHHGSPLDDSVVRDACMVRDGGTSFYARVFFDNGVFDNQRVAAERCIIQDFGFISHHAMYPNKGRWRYGGGKGYPSPLGARGLVHMAIADIVLGGQGNTKPHGLCTA
jgi:hypothetical protein